jgi:hypothetical protein
LLCLIAFLSFLTISDKIRILNKYRVSKFNEKLYICIYALL